MLINLINLINLSQFIAGVANNNHVVLNSYNSLNSTWGNEEKQPLVIMLDDGTAIRAFSQVINY